jgi:hypothetical protein
MTGYHITENARLKILKEIGVRAQRTVLEYTWNWSVALHIDLMDM